jgi:peptidoglycan hydrolase-like protein with peptidoglycan-binding domain
MLLAQGSRGAEVYAVQSLLRQLNYPIALDGYYGTQTAAAVADFQWKQGLGETGQVDDSTWRQMDATLRSIGQSMAIAMGQAVSVGLPLGTTSTGFLGMDTTSWLLIGGIGLVALVVMNR